MSYRLNLNKTKMYELMQHYRTDLPKLRACEFSRNGRTYWMKYTPSDGICYCVRCTVTCCAGSVIIRFVHCFFDGTPEVQASVCEVPFDYLLSHGMLKEAA